MKPFLKWIGGKTQIIDIIINEYPKKMDNYHDIFLGGGSTLFALLTNMKNGNITVLNNIYAYDINENLINVYKNIQKNPDELYKRLEEIMNEYFNCNGMHINRNPKNKEEAITSQESYYYWVRNKYNNEKDTILNSAMFIFLNKTCFRGLYRIGPNGFNVPFGHYKNVKIIDKNTLFEINKLIKDVEFKCIDFEKSILTIKKGDFAYLDPPYVPEKNSSFVKYNLDGFDIEKNKKLFLMCEQMRLNNINFMMSNSFVKMIKDYFPKEKYSLGIIKCRRAINCKNPGEKTNEIIIKTNSKKI